MKFYVFYNCKLMAIYKSIKSAVKYINRKGLKDDRNNILYIADEEGNMYTPTGEKVDIFDED